MSDSNLKVSKANRASETSGANASERGTNEMSELNDLTKEPSSLERSAKHITKFRLDEINKIKD